MNRLDCREWLRDWLKYLFIDLKLWSLHINQCCHCCGFTMTLGLSWMWIAAFFHDSWVACFFWFVFSTVTCFGLVWFSVLFFLKLHTWCYVIITYGFSITPVILVVIPIFQLNQPPTPGDCCDCAADCSCRQWKRSTHTHTTILWPFFRHHPGEPVPEENFWTIWCKGRLTEAGDAPYGKLLWPLVIFGHSHLHSRTDSQALRAEYCIVGIPYNTAI